LSAQEQGLAAVTPSRVAHNTLLNFLGLAVPLALAFFVMPVAARHLGPARFGLLGLAWAVTEYLILFDLGLGRAIVRFVADALQQRQAAVGEIVSVATSSQLLAGIIGGTAFAFGAPAFVHLVLKTSPGLSEEAIGMFRVVGFNLPVVLLLSSLRGVLEGAQRFDLSNAIKTLSSAASLVIPAVGALNGLSLPAIMWIILVSRVIVCCLFAAAIHHALPDLRWHPPRQWTRLKELLAYGGWVAVSSGVSPILVYFDRFALGSIVGLTTVGFYTAPYEGVSRLLLVPVSLIGSLLPALTALEARRDRQRFGQILGSSMRTLLVVMAVPLTVVFVFAPELLRLWLGQSYADQSSVALRILAIGVFANSVAHPPFVTLYAIGRPDLPAKFHILELLIHIPLTIFLVGRFGIVGAASSWSIRVTLDLCLLLVAASRTTNLPVTQIAGGRVLRSAVSVGILVAVLLAAAKLFHAYLGITLLAIIVVSCLFFVASWSWVLLAAERDAIRGVFSRSMRGATLASRGR
jgi:O-antigen/teichoic acid export membrane protein